MTPVIETPRLLLRPFRESDAADVFRYIGYRIMRFFKIR